MLDIDIAALDQCVADVQKILKEGLIATDIWDKDTGLSLAGYNPQPEATALFNQLTNEMQQTLSGSGFPGLNRYYLLDLEGANTVVCQRHGEDLMSGMLLDAEKVNLGILVSVVIPKYAAGVAAARNTQD
ncbi:MAG: hypothetical protein R2731_09200 [Nocardioides sp.]